MTKFLMKCFFVTTILFFGMLLGIQMASNNLVQMTGDTSYSTEKLLKQDDESVYSHTSTENNRITSHDLEGKQEKLEQIESFNLFSQMGSTLADLLQVVFSNLLSKLTATIGEVLT